MTTQFLEILVHQLARLYNTTMMLCAHFNQQMFTDMPRIKFDKGFKYFIHSDRIRFEKDLAIEQPYKTPGPRYK